MRPLELYLHIPFCVQKCKYCDFLSAPAPAGERREYVESLCRQIRKYHELAKAYHVVSIFIGGGTPSLLESCQMERIVEAVRETFLLEEDVEFTIEANPGTLTMEKLETYRKLGVNRLSLGLQSADNDELKRLGRIHTYEEFLESFRLARQAGFGNINVDLMSGIPGQTLTGFEHTLKTVAELGPEHISAYHLIYEENTSLWKLKEKHAVEETDEELSLTFFSMLIRTLKSQGYRHYEISNFCLPGYHSRHNSGYWDESLYLGCGASAHSYNGTSRQWNIASLEKYIAGMEQETPEYEIEELNLYTRYNDFVITTLRTSRGMPLDRLREEFGEPLRSYCLRMAKPYVNEHKLEIKDGFLRLTGSGIFVSDGIMSDMLWVED